ncbi:MAG: nucleotide exchange factor GrpE [Acidobacteriota bacterium]|nr:nucleotide exchange factor GrpE [Acidobacteriota bacterium]MDE3093747.1 nucleotide exchange factor GrpE [Acidobacteriota bacterium]MDE3146418.1 nucleotide exchange factor GrpE [Acidobacteriota bacterium]
MSETFEPDEVAASEDAVTQDISELTEAELQRDEYLDALQHLQADFENYRKRVARSSEDAAQRAAGTLVASLLPVLDAFDLAAAHFAATPSEEGTALNQSRALLLDTLEKQGLERLGEEGEPFDPQVHDAVAHVEGEDAEQLVEEVLRAGYRWKGSVLRPAMVKVRG